MECPKCKCTDKLTLADHQPLYCPSHKSSDAEYQLDKELYATCKCWNCNHTFEVKGMIDYKVR